MDNAASAERPLTFGERAVGLTFNPGGREDVDACKRAFAAEIDRMDELRSNTPSPEQARLASVAITELQGAQMWAVKALTWNSFSRSATCSSPTIPTSLEAAPNRCRHER